MHIRSLLQALRQHTQASTSVRIYGTILGLHNQLGLLLEIRFGQPPAGPGIGVGSDRRTVWRGIAYLDPYSFVSEPIDPWLDWPPSAEAAAPKEEVAEEEEAEERTPGDSPRARPAQP